MQKSENSQVKKEKHDAGIFQDKLCYLLCSTRPACILHAGTQVLIYLSTDKHKEKL